MDPIGQAQKTGYAAGIKPDEFWKLTPWELNQWLIAKSEIMEGQAKTANLLLIANAWHTGKYMRVDHFPRSLANELERLKGGSNELSPEESRDHLASYLRSLTASKEIRFD